MSSEVGIHRLIADSKHRYTGTENNYRIRLPEHVWYRTVELRKALIPTSYRAIDDFFVLDEGGGDIDVTVSGSYDRSGFETYLGSQLTSAGANTYTVTIDPNTFLMTITSTGTFVIRWSLMEERIQCMLGGDTVDTASLGSHTLGAVNLSGTKVIYVETNLTHGNHMVLDDTFRNFFPIPVSVTQGSFIVYEPSTMYRDLSSKVGRTNIDELHIRIFDEWMNPVDFQGQDSIVELELTI